MKAIDIYDFDKTIVPFDSGSLFAVWCLVHYPWAALCLPFIAGAAFLMAFKIINLNQFKKNIFCFVRFIPLKKAVCRFWNKYEKKVNPWFKSRKRECVIISASPDFLLCEIAKRLGVKNLICTRHNPKTGAIIGENCRGAEKVKRFHAEFPGRAVEDVYSDSLRHDKSIFSLACGSCYLVKDRKVLKFDFDKAFQNGGANAENLL
ncbi:MAG: haloacid dehalogenase-like hydrolase [Clostridiales bacterium]|nr:haloacid dehalogenase-like hydrolase [Clostridiales bacterium]